MFGNGALTGEFSSQPIFGKLFTTNSDTYSGPSFYFNTVFANNGSDSDSETSVKRLYIRKSKRAPR